MNYNMLLVEVTNIPALQSSVYITNKIKNQL